MTAYAVAGANGHTGSVVAQTLLEQGRKVRVLVRDPHKAERWRKRGADVLVMDLGNAHDLAAGLRGVEAAYLLLPPFPPATIGVRGRAKRMLDAMVQAIGGSDLKHLVFLSWQGAQQANGTGLVALLHDAEQELRTLKTPVTFLRSTYFIENWIPAIPDAKEGLLNTFLPAELRWGHLSTHDVGHTAAQLLLEHPKAHRVVELDGPEVAGSEDVARVLAKLLSTEVEPLVEPLDQMAEALTGMGFSPEHAAMIQATHQAIASGLMRWEHPESVRRGKETLEQALAAILSRL